MLFLSENKFSKNIKQENLSLAFYKFIIHTCYKLSGFLKLIQIRKIKFFYLFYVEIFNYKFNINLLYDKGNYCSKVYCIFRVFIYPNIINDFFSKY